MKSGETRTTAPSAGSTSPNRSWAERTAMGPALRAFTALACLVPVVYMAVLVKRMAINSPYWDEWGLVPLLEKQAAGRLGLRDLFMQHNEHRPFFPVTISVEMARLTHWDIRAEVFLDFVLAVALTGLLIWLVRRTLGIDGWGLTAFAIIMAAWLTVSPVQWENWLWGWQMEWFLCNLAAMTSAALLAHWPEQRPAWLGVALAAGAAVVASFSLASGLAVWIAFLLFFALRRSIRRALPVWCVAGAASISLFFYHYTSDSHLGFAAHHPLAFAKYLLDYLAASIVPPGWWTPWVGLALLIAFVGSVLVLFRWHRERFGRAAVWIAVGLNTLLSAAVTDVGRLNLGIGQSESSRYTTLSSLFIFGTLVLVLMVTGTFLPAWRRQVWVRILEAAVVAVVAIVTLFNYNLGTQHMDNRHALFLANQSCLAHAQNASDPCLSQTYPDPKFEWPLLQFLRAHGLGGQRPPG